MIMHIPKIKRTMTTHILKIGKKLILKLMKMAQLAMSSKNNTAYIHAHTYTNSHIRRYTHTHTLTYARAHTHTHTLAHTQTQTHTRARATYIHTYIHTCIHRYFHVR